MSDPQSFLLKYSKVFHIHTLPSNCIEVTIFFTSKVDCDNFMLFGNKFASEKKLELSFKKTLQSITVMVLAKSTKEAESFIEALLEDFYKPKDTAVFDAIPKIKFEYNQNSNYWWLQAKDKDTLSKIYKLFNEKFDKTTVSQPYYEKDQTYLIFPINDLFGKDQVEAMLEEVLKELNLI